MNRTCKLYGIVVCLLLIIGSFLYYSSYGYGHTEEPVLIEDNSIISEIVVTVPVEEENVTTAPVEETTVTTSEEDISSDTAPMQEDVAEVSYRFRNNKLLTEHYNKHGKEMGFSSASEYQDAASAVINNPVALNKIEAEDGDYVYYVEATNEFVVLSTDGYIRTYFLPDSGKKYYDKQ